MFQEDVNMYKWKGIKQVTSLWRASWARSDSVGCSWSARRISANETSMWGGLCSIIDIVFQGEWEICESGTTFEEFPGKRRSCQHQLWLRTPTLNWDVSRHSPYEQKPKIAVGHVFNQYRPVQSRSFVASFSVNLAASLTAARGCCHPCRCTWEALCLESKIEIPESAVESHLPQSLRPFLTASGSIRAFSRCASGSMSGL